jgi:uncharacterized Tic20 family protein
MNNSIPLKIRLLATSFHALNALFPVFSIFAILIIWILWLFTRNIHPFINLAGRNALNCAINNLLWMTVGMTLFIMAFSLTCGVGNQNPSPLMTTLLMISFTLVSLIVFAYVIYALVAGIYAFRGVNFKSRLIYPFIQD